MPVLPIPMFIALLLAGLLVSRLVGQRTNATLLLLIGTCSIQSALMALIHYYGVTELRPIQPVIACAIPALAWIAIRQASIGRLPRKELPIHLLGPCLGVFILLTFPAGLDVVIPLLFGLYGTAILLFLRRGEDSLPHNRLEHGEIPFRVWRILAFALILSAISDTYIAYRLAFDDPSALLWVPSLLGSLSLLILGAGAVSQTIQDQIPPSLDRTKEPNEATPNDSAILDSLTSLFDTQKPFLDPDLSLARLAKRLGVPEKTLSGAINRRTGENVSRFVNAYRIHHASELIRAGSSVTEAMLASGFNTKSNFNREFLRIQQMSPKQWREKTQQAEKPR